MHRKIVDQLYALNPNTVKLGLENISNLLYHLDNPHKKLNTTHIAGTNGKGSTAFFLNSIFNAAGYKTGVYLSPHLIDIRERIIIGNDWIPEKKFAELTEYIFCVIEKERLSATFFEFVTALAFLYFFQEEIDIGIIEVGLGGRLDATNVLTPMVSVITEIDLEHTNYLGSSIREITAEKGGIIKEGGTVFTSAENEEAVDTIKGIAKKKRATCFQFGKDFVIDDHDEELPLNAKKLLLPQTFSLRFRKHEFKKLAIKTAGTYQIKNSSTAVAVALYLSEKYRAINENSICEGLKNTKIPCRMELVQKSPQVVLDAAHNFQATQALIENIPLFFTYNRLIVLLGILDDKDYKKVIKVLSSETDTFIMTEPKTERALSARLLEKEALAFETETFVEKEIAKALIKAKEVADTDDLILVTGSFYTVGEALSELS
ncbi:MAG: folylpolyglutamate synthase/dihydrofolate synthase family protein [Nitrospinota bacterium]